MYMHTQIRLEFLVDVSDRLEGLPPTEPWVVDLEARASLVFAGGSGGGWDGALCAALRADLSSVTCR